VEDPVPDERHGLTVIEGPEDTDLDIRTRRLACSRIDSPNITPTPSSNFCDVVSPDADCINREGLPLCLNDMHGHSWTKSAGTSA
jgi:hypothetical protein